MATLVTIRGENCDYALSAREDFPLDFDMLDGGTEFRYSIGTSDTEYADSKIKLANTLRQMKSAMGRNRSLQRVTISNNVEFVTFNNPRIEITEAFGEIYLEVMSKEIATGYNNNPTKKRAYVKLWMD
jgi:hypothetical protein